jgi:hypothetical protein
MLCFVEDCGVQVFGSRFPEGERGSGPWRSSQTAALKFADHHKKICEIGFQDCDSLRKLYRRKADWRSHTLLCTGGVDKEEMDAGQINDIVFL